MKEFSALRKRIRVRWHPDGSARMTIPNAYGGVNEIGRIETSVSSQRGTNIGQVKWVEIDPKFRGMGLATKMYGEAMKGAPRGRLVSDNAQYDGGHGIWNKLQRSKGYKIRENPKIDGAGFDDLISRDGRPMFIGRINPAARMQWAQSRLDERSLRSFKPSSSKEYFSAKLRLRELARGDFAIPAVEAILGRKLGAGAKDALRNRGQKIHAPDFVGKKLKSEAEAQLKGKGLAGERQVQYTDVVPTLVLPDRFRPGQSTPQWYTPRYGIHNSQVTPSKLRSILKDGLQAKPASGGQPPLLFMHPSGESAGVVGKFPAQRHAEKGSLSFLTENPGDFSYSRGGAAGSITSKIDNKRNWIIDPEFYGGKPIPKNLKQVLDDAGTKPIIPETIGGDGVSLLYPKEYFGDYNRNYWAKKIRENRSSKNLSAKLRLREFGQPISATKKLLRWLKSDGVSVGRPDEIEQAMARLAGRKQVGSYSPSKRSISIGKGSDLNILWHEAGHHRDRKKLLKSKPTWEREVKADNNAESLLRKFGGNIDHYQMPVDSRGIVNRDAARRTPIAPINKQDDGRPLFYDEFSTRAKACLRELARGDYAIPALGKMLKDRSLLEEFLTGKRGPKLGDLAVGRFQMNKRALRTKNGRTTLSGYPKSPVDVSVSKVVKTPAGKEIPGDMERIREQWVSDSYGSRHWPPKEKPQVTNQMLHQARQRARDKVAKIIRKGRAGGDVYEELSAKRRLRELARGDYAIPALGKMLKDRSLLEEFLTGKRGPKLGDLMASKVGNGLRSAPIRVKGRLERDNKFVMEGITHSIKNPASTAAREGIAMGLKARDLRVREMYPAGRQQARDTIAKMIRKGRAGGDVYEVGGIYPEYGFSAKLRLRELARGDYAIPALGKMLKDRSMLEEFLTGKRGPKMGDLRHNFNGGITDDRTLAGHIPGLIVGYGIPDRPFVANARQKGRDAIAKIIRKGRAGGDVYEEVDRS